MNSSDTSPWWAYGPAVLDSLFGVAQCMHVSIYCVDVPPQIDEVRASLGLSRAQTVAVDSQRPSAVANIDLLRLTPGGVFDADGERLSRAERFPLELVEYDLDARNVIRVHGTLSAYSGLDPEPLLRLRLDAEVAYLASIRTRFEELDAEFEAWRSTVRS